MSVAQQLLDEVAADVPCQELADAYLEFDRPPGDDPVLLVAEAAASTTGQSYVEGIHPTVERFRESFVEAGRVETLAEVADLDIEDDDLVEAFGAERKRHVLLEAAAVLADRPESDDLDALVGWAAEADHYRYDEDPIGAVSGVGPSTFQYLRMMAGMDTAKPDPQLEELLGDLSTDIEPITDATGLRAIAATEWLSYVTTYRMLEIDRLAWWLYTEEDERTEALELA